MLLESVNYSIDFAKLEAQWEAMAVADVQVEFAPISF